MEEAEPGQSEWQIVAPAEAGFDESKLAAIDSAYRSGLLPNLHSLIICRHGRLVFERYCRGSDELLGQPLGEIPFDESVLHDMRSVSKSIVGLLYGIALDEGVVPRPDASLLDQFPSHTDLASDAIRRRWTIQHALTMQLGIEWDESLPCTDPRNGEIAMEQAPDRYRFVLERPIVDEPGIRWNYCGGATALLGHLISRGGGVSLLDFAFSRLLAPLGIKDVAWTPGSDGEPAAAAGLRMRPRDLAKIGQVIIQKGSWDGTELVPPSWLEQAFQPRARTPWGWDYGYHWYLGDVGGLRWVGANGNGGQHLFVVPELQLVLACTAGNYNKWDGPNIPVELRKIVLAAIR